MLAQGGEGVVGVGGALDVGGDVLREEGPCDGLGEERLEGDE